MASNPADKPLRCIRVVLTVGAAALTYVYTIYHDFPLTAPAVAANLGGSALSSQTVIHSSTDSSTHGQLLWREYYQLWSSLFVPFALIH
ncbi:hypothetical protein EDB92DRAFT_1948755 [Lactarius akahatsu]|uniref:Uncharacterized protein n=1 Tax=Lactarius akahatsu TaxID=416441 RepID=A0AAD4LG29_9AGAM|nr:hypothetical protein EDB92DRAFT_1948755 [Lactarius akahatsu]